MLTVLFAASVGACDHDPQPWDYQFLSQCGRQLDYFHINDYNGQSTFVDEREDAVVMINRDCSGTYIGDVSGLGSIILTAGHCLSEDEVLVTFNYEVDPDGYVYEGFGTVLEASQAPDYGLVVIEPVEGVIPTPLGARLSSHLAIIQHPLGGPKQLAEGALVSCQQGVLHYRDLDTLVGASGAGILNREGRLIGIHSGGECISEGSNFGPRISSIIDASALLTPDLLEDC